MQAKDILKDIHANTLLLSSYKNEIHLWDSMVDRINTISGSDALGVKMASFRDSLIKGAESIVDETKSFIDLVKNLEDSRQREIIVGRYIEGKSMNAIASDIGFSLMQTNRLHSAALEQLDKMLMNEGAVS